MNTNLYEKIEKDGEEIYKPYDITKITICGRTIEQVMQILNGLDLEKEKEMTLTMNNLGKWIDMIKKEIEEQQIKAINDFFKVDNE